MKTVISEIPLVKVSVKQDRTIDITLAGGKQFTGELTENELEQILYRITKATDGVVAFDPEPQDFIGVHEQDLKTLEEQSGIIVELRTQLDAAIKLSNEIADERDKITAQRDAAENQMDELRRELKTLKALTVHNVQSEVPTDVVEVTPHNVQSEVVTEAVEAAP
jgi:hypothetical protein